MPELHEYRCVPCRGDVPPMSMNEIEANLSSISNWQLVRVNDIPQLQRVFLFSNFKQALDFTIKVGEAAEEEGLWAFQKTDPGH